MPKTLKFITITLLSFLFVPLIGQESEDTVKVSVAWKLTDDYSKYIQQGIDTTLDKHQVINPLHHKSTLYNYLGNLATPSINGVFSDRESENYFFITRSILPYIYTPENTIYYNTRKPITKIRYSSSVVDDKEKEETLHFFHTQNMKPNLNFGINYYLVKAGGNYLFQAVKHNAGKIQLNYLGDRYTLNTNINISKYSFDENGGINDSVFFVALENNTDTKVIGTNFNGSSGSAYSSDANNLVKQTDFFILQKYRLGQEFNDSVETEESLNLELAHIFQYKSAMKNFTHVSPGDVYDHYFINRDYVSDSITFNMISNTIRVELNESGKLNAALRAEITNEIQNYHWYVTRPQQGYNYLQSLDLANKTDSINYYTYRKYFVNGDDTLKTFRRSVEASNTYLTAALYNKIQRSWDWNVKGQYYILGRQFGDVNLQGYMSRIFGSDSLISLNLKASYNLKTPQVLYSEMYTNSMIWDYVYQKENRVYIAGELGLPKYGLLLKASQLNMYNFVYLNEDIEPRQLNRLITVYTLSGEQKVKFGVFNSINRVAIQKSTDKDVLDLPLVSLMSRNYIKFTMNFPSTGGKLDNMFGFELRYNTKYYADAYSPELMSFYQQREKEVGGYPYFDVFYNLKLKRVYFSAIYQHLNYHLTNHYDNFFQLVPGYSRNPGVFKINISWLFYN